MEKNQITLILFLKAEPAKRLLQGYGTVCLSTASPFPNTKTRKKGWEWDMVVWTFRLFVVLWYNSSSTVINKTYTSVSTASRIQVHILSSS